MLALRLDLLALAADFLALAFAVWFRRERKMFGA